MSDRSTTPDWFEPRLPRPQECSIGDLLRQRALHDPERTFVIFDNGRQWTHAEAYRLAHELAGKLRALGVRRGDHVAVWQPNGPNMFRALFACSLLGATASLLNIAWRGNLLAHALQIADANVLYAHGELIERLDGVNCGALRKVLTSEAIVTQVNQVAITLESELDPQATFDIELADPWDIAAIIFTSGTTGASKGVRVTNCQLWSLGQAYYGFLGPEDRMLLMLPLFHIAALGALHGTMAKGGSFSVMESFRPGDFWQIVRNSVATTNVGSGRGLLALLLKQPANENDRNHKLHQILVASVDPTVRAFCARFGCSVYAGYSMSETSAIAVSEVDPKKDRSVGRFRKGIEGRLVDEHDIEVARGTPGELIIRASLPWVLNDGYHKDPEATASAWRNGWFHTGDIFIQDEDGDLFFVDRLKDAIRRRGENISSAELEAEIRAHPAVREVAAIGVDTADGEEVLAVVELMPGVELNPAELVAFLAERVPHYMVPRFIRVTTELPRTETTKVKKTELRARGLTPDCWDREAVGIKIRRQTLST